MAQDATADLANKVSHPVASLINVRFHGNQNGGLSSGNGTQDVIDVRPAIPISISSCTVISRTVIPFVALDGIPAASGQTGGVGNIVQSLFHSRREPTAAGLVRGVGPVLQLPTASDGLLGPKQCGAGVTAVGLVPKNGRTHGMLANPIRPVGNEDRRDESANAFLQPFVSSETPRGTSVALNTERTGKLVSEEWSFPVNLSVAQIIKASARPVQPSAGVRHRADSPACGPDGWGRSWV